MRRSGRRSRCTSSSRRCALSRCPATHTATSASRPEYSAQTFKHILVPVWLLAYTYGAARYQVVVNGYTGATAGQYPKSPWKILFVTLLVLVLVLIVMYASQ